VDATDVVLTVKFAVVPPAATVTEAGSVAERLLLASAIEMPPAGAAAVKVTVPVAEFPPTTLVGDTATEESATVTAGVIVSGVVLLVPP
jgi:hypothetical protein